MRKVAIVAGGVLAAMLLTGTIAGTGPYCHGGACVGITGVNTATAAPTLTGFCTSPTVTWGSTSLGINRDAVLQLDVGSTCAGVSTGTLTLPAAANGWECKCTNTTAAATRVVDSSGWSATTVVITNYSRTLGTAADWADGADIRCACLGNP